MPIIRIRYKRILFFLIIIIIFLALVANIKWIGKILYPIKYNSYIIEYTQEYEIDPLLVAAIIRVESKYYKDAQSHKGARGLMQIAPITGKWAAEQMNIENYNQDLLYNPRVNIMIGCWYLDRLMDQFNNNLPVVIAAYNGGSGNVNKWLRDERYSMDGVNLEDIPFPETKQYVEKVLKGYKIYKFLYTNELNK